MADIVNRVLKILFLVFLCLQLNTSSPSKSATEDSNEEKLSDFLAVNKEFPHADRYRRDLKSRSRKASGNKVIIPRPQVPAVPVPLPTVGDLPSIDAASSVCLPNPCQNGGLCGADSAGAYMCACTLGYRGKFCQEVMMKCTQIGCKGIADCLSAPNGAICMCKLGGMTRLCQSDMHSPSTWEKVRLVISEQTIHTGEIIVGVVFGILALFAVLFGIHCHRVNVRRAIVRKRYKDILEQGIIPSEPPPDWCEISNDLLKKFICCKKGKTVFDSYKPKKSLTTLKQKEDELIHLLNSHAAAFDQPPSSRCQLTQDDFQDHPPVSKQYYPQSTSIPQDHPPVSRRLYSQSAMQDNPPSVSKRSSREQGINYTQMGRLDTDRDVNGYPSMTRTGRSVGTGSVQAIVDEINQSRNNHASLQKKYSLQDHLKKRPSKQSQHSYPVKRDVTESLTRLRKLGNLQKYSTLGRQRKGNNFKDDYDDFDDDHVSDSSYKHKNNSARQKSDKSRKTKVKPVSYSHLGPEAPNGRKQKYKVYRTMDDITDNLGNVRKSMSNRKNSRSYDALTKTLQASQSRHRSKELEESMNDITNTTDKYNTDSCSEDNSDLDRKLLIMINEENVKPDRRERWHPYSFRNGNENAKSGRLSNSSADLSMLYNDNMSYYQQQRSNPSCYTSTYAAELAAGNFNMRKNTDNAPQQSTYIDDQMFYGHLIDPSMKHDNLETTNWYWDHEPGMGIYNTDINTRNRQESTTSNKDTDTGVKSFENKLDFDKMTAYHYKYGSSDLYSKTKRCSKENQEAENESKDFITEKNYQLKDIQSEDYRTWPLNLKYSQDKNEAYKQKLNTYKSIDPDMSTDRLYVRSFNEDGEKRYFISNEHAFRIDSKYQPCPEDNPENLVKMSTCLPTESENLSQNQCSTPLQSNNLTGEIVSNNVNNLPSIGNDTPVTPIGTPSTPIGTEDDTTVINASNVDGDTLTNVESNASETEVEL